MNKYELKITKLENEWKKLVSKVKLTNKYLALKRNNLKLVMKKSMEDISTKATFEEKDRQLIELRQQIAELKAQHKEEINKMQIRLDEQTKSGQNWHNKYLEEKKMKAQLFEENMKLKEKL